MAHLHSRTAATPATTGIAIKYIVTEFRATSFGLKCSFVNLESNCTNSSGRSYGFLGI